MPFPNPPCLLSNRMPPSTVMLALRWHDILELVLGPESRSLVVLFGKVAITGQPSLALPTIVFVMNTLRKVPK